MSWYKSLLYPKNIAIIGASAKEGSIGHQLVKSIIENGYKGEIYPVNPKYSSILGLKCYKNIKEIPMKIDLAIISIPAKYTLSIIKEAVGKLKTAVVISSGFSEAGNKNLEQQLVKTAREGNIRILGPNCAGIISKPVDLHASFEPKIHKGNIAFITQSGALGGAVLPILHREKIGLSHFISIGNMADLAPEDFIPHLVEDKNVEAIALYIEGFKNARKLFVETKKATKKKPVIILKAGRTEAGMQAAISHTASLTTSHKIAISAMKQAKAIIAKHEKEMINIIKAITKQKKKFKDIIIITNSGGPSVILTDLLEEANIKIKETPPHLREALKPITGISTAKNPIDLTATAGYKEYLKAIKTVDENNNLIAAICIPPKFKPATEFVKAVIDANPQNPLLCLVEGENTQEAREKLEKKGYPVFKTTRDLADAIIALYTLNKNS